jgi:hypothetical protein
MDMCIVSLSISSPLLIVDEMEACIHVGNEGMEQGHLETQDFVFQIDLETTRNFSYLYSKSQLLENIFYKYI